MFVGPIQRLKLQTHLTDALKLCCVATVIAATNSTCGSASTVTYNLTGRVTEIGLRNYEPVVIGQLIPIAITVEQRSASPTMTSGSQIYNGFYFGAPYESLIGNAFINGTDYASLAQRIVVTAGSGISFNTAGPQISYGFQLSLGDALTGVLPTTDIPTSLLPGQFASGSFSVVEAFTASSYGYSGTIVGLAETNTVPEPNSMLLLASGLTTVVMGALRAKTRG